MNEVTIIKPKRGLIPIDFKELYQYRELLWTLLVRDIKVKYKQTVIGGLWAVLQPFLTMVVFSFFFGKIAKMPSEGVPYPIFSYSGLVLWTYFANSLGLTSSSMLNSISLITKVYFPRMVLPLSASLKGLLDYLIAVVIVFGFMFYYKTPLRSSIILLPFVVFFTWLLVSGMGFWLSAINIRFRDVKYIIPFFTQLWLFVTPVIYPASVAEKFKLIVVLNPMSGFVEAHRAILLSHHPVDWNLFGISSLLTLLIFISGAYYFKSVERHFADIA